MGRYGGDEFAVILPGTGEETAREPAEYLNRFMPLRPLRANPAKAGDAKPWV